MKNSFYIDEGFDFLEEVLAKYDVSDEKIFKSLEKGAKALADDVRKLPKPRSQIQKAGYTHLLDTVTYKREKDDIAIGWGKYYGPMVENGTKKTGASPHIKTTFAANKDKYNKMMIQDLF